MKRAVILAAAALFAASASHAAKFNPEAMAKMQQEGKKIAELATPKPYRLPSGKCLGIAGASPNVNLQDCNNSPNQKWRFDKEGHFINGNGRCLRFDGTHVLAVGCGGAPAFKWSRSGNAGLQHVSGKCLTAAGAQVTVAPCSGGGNQQWQ